MDSFCEKKMGNSPSAERFSPPRKRSRKVKVNLPDLNIPSEYWLNYKNYTFERSLGEGSFGCTFLVSKTGKKAKYALKIVRVRDEDINWEETQREVSMGLLITHMASDGTTGALPFFSPMYKAQTVDYLEADIQDVMWHKCPNLYNEWVKMQFEGPFVFTLMEVSPGGDLKAIRNISYDNLRTLAFGLVWGFHGASASFGFVHNDLNMGNVLKAQLQQESYFQVNDLTFKVRQDAVVPKVIDLGFAFVFTNKAARNNIFLGTFHVQPPEGLASYFYTGEEPDRTIAGDMWAVGSNLVSIITQRGILDYDSTDWEDELVNDMLLEAAVDFSSITYGAKNHPTIGIVLVRWYAFCYVLNGYRKPSNTDKLESSLQAWTLWIQNESHSHNDLVQSPGGQYATFLQHRLSLWTYNGGVSSEDITKLMSFLKQLFSWDTSGRENTETGLVPLLQHPYFKALRVEQNQVPSDPKKYTLRAEPSLYNQKGNTQRKRIDEIQESGFKINKRCIIGCDVTQSPYFCQCCLRFYCSEEHANKSDVHR